MKKPAFALFATIFFGSLLFMRTWIALTLLLATDGVGHALSHYQHIECDCGRLLHELSLLQRKAAEDDARIADLESRLARAETVTRGETFAAQGELGVDRIPNDPLCMPLGFTSPASSPALVAVQWSHRCLLAGRLLAIPRLVPKASCRRTLAAIQLKMPAPMCTPTNSTAAAGSDARR